MVNTSPGSTIFVSIRGEYGHTVDIPIAVMERILEEARAEAVDHAPEGANRFDILCRIRARRHQKVRQWAQDQGIPFLPDA